MKMAQDTRIQSQCQEVESCLRKNNGKKDLTREKQEKSKTYTTIWGSVSKRSMQALTDGQSTAQTFTTMRLMGTQQYLTVRKYQMNSITLSYDKRWKQQSKHWVDNIQAELVQAGGEAMIDILTSVCNKIWKTGKWPTTWTKSRYHTPKESQLASQYFNTDRYKAVLLLWFLTVTCSCCPYLYFGSTIMLVTYFVILGSWMTTYFGKSCSFGLPRVPFVNCRQFMHLVVSLLVLRAGCEMRLYQFLIIGYRFTLQLCQNYRSISLISPHSRVMLKVIINRLQSHAEEFLAE